MYTVNSTASYPVPTANIAVNRNRVKHYDGNKVYLKDGTHFEIELYNPKTIKVLAKIHINGKALSNTGIVLRPGERVFLERFLDKPNKFLFETYSVEDSKESREAIAQNGFVRVEFFDESLSSQFTFTGGSVNTLLLTDSPSWTNTTTYLGTIGSNGPTGPSGVQGVDGIPPYGGTTVNYCSLTTVSGNASVAGSLETGRVESGESSNQNFNQDSTKFDWYCSKQVDISILPESQKPVEANQIRNYCTECGTRMKSKGWKFCPTCGTKI